jgi:hypothetical protein
MAAQGKDRRTRRVSDVLSFIFSHSFLSFSAPLPAIYLTSRTKQLLIKLSKTHVIRLLICSSILKEAGSYLKLFCSEDIKKEVQNDADKKLLELAGKTGMALINLFLFEELSLQAELLISGNGIGDGDVELISEQALEKILHQLIEVRSLEIYNNKYFKHAEKVSGKVLQCLRNRSLLIRKGESGIQEATRTQKRTQLLTGITICVSSCY